jgi:hypothetical protein
MFNVHSWKSGTAALLALTITGSAIVPIVTAAPAFSQVSYPQREIFPRRDLTNVVIPSGTSISVRYDKEKIVVMPDEKVPLTLTVATAVKASNGEVLIPEGSQIVGELKPVSGGTQFVAKEITLYARRRERQTRPYLLNATSNVVKRTEEVKQGANARSILTGAAVGGAAATALAALIGDNAIATEEVLGGLGLGALGGLFLNRKTATMNVIYPNRDLTVKLNSQFALR